MLTTVVIMPEVIPSRAYPMLLGSLTFHGVMGGCRLFLCSFEYASWSRNDSLLMQIWFSFFFIILLTNHALKNVDTFL